MTKTMTCHVNVNGHDVLFKKHTGAEVIFISDNITESIGLQQLNHPTKKLHGPHNYPLEVMGEATVRLVYRGQSAHNPSLWWGMLSKTCSASLQFGPYKYSSMWMQSHSRFQSSSLEIRLKPDAQPFALCTPRNVPLLLRKSKRNSHASSHLESLPSWRPNSLVCWDGGRSKEIWCCKHLRRLSVPQRQRSEGSPSITQGWWEPCEAGWGIGVQ